MLVFSSTDFPPEGPGDAIGSSSSFDDVCTYVKVNAHLQGSPVTIVKSDDKMKLFKCVNHRSGCGFQFRVIISTPFGFGIPLCKKISRKNSGQCVHRCKCLSPVCACSCDLSDDDESDEGFRWRWIGGHLRDLRFEDSDSDED